MPNYNYFEISKFGNIEVIKGFLTSLCLCYFTLLYPLSYRDRGMTFISIAFKLKKILERIETHHLNF